MSKKGTEYSEEVAIEICSRIAGGEPLTKICRDGAMPNTSTVYKWLSQKEDFLRLYNTARADQAHSLFSEMLEIADDSSGDVTKDKDGRIVVDHENINRSRLRVDARKFACARLLPKVYGERTEIVGAGGEALIPPTELTQERIIDGARRMALILYRADLLQRNGGAPSALPLRLTHELPRVDLHGNPLPPIPP